MTDSATPKEPVPNSTSGNVPRATERMRAELVRRYLWHRSNCGRLLPAPFSGYYVTARFGVACRRSRICPKSSDGRLLRTSGCFSKTRVQRGKLNRRISTKLALSLSVQQRLHLARLRLGRIIPLPTPRFKRGSGLGRSRFHHNVGIRGASEMKSTETPALFRANTPSFFIFCVSLYCRSHAPWRHLA